MPHGRASIGIAPPESLQPQCDIRQAFGLDEGLPLVDDIRRLRNRVLAVPVAQAIDRADHCSRIFLATIDRRAVATLRVTYARLGPIDCEHFFPTSLLEAFRPHLGSASRFCTEPGTSVAVARRLIDDAWTAAINDGLCADLIDVSTRGIAYYRRLGYLPLASAPFRHPLLGTVSHGMVFPTDPGRRTQLQHLFTGLQSFTTVEAFRPWLPSGLDGES